MYIDSGYKGFIKVIRNGIDVKNFVAKEKGNNRSICLGRIEPRKRQSWLANIISERVNLDFAGPIADKTFKAEGHCRYIGYWTKEEVYKNLSEYNCLVLLSDGEAAPLVVPEALAAGLSVVVSSSASANLDNKLPFVSILNNDISNEEMIAETINNQIINNAMYRTQIIEYAKTYFDISAVVADFLKVVEEFKNTNNKPKYHYKIRFKNFPIYLLSKFAFFIKSLLRDFRKVPKPINETRV